MHVNIICMKWGTKYPPTYVNKLYRMVARHLSLPFTMTCFTDDDYGVDAAVSIQPLPNLDLPIGIPERGWMKLATLADHFGGLIGTTLFLDLDVVIVGSLDAFLTHGAASPETVFLAYDEKKSQEQIGNSSVYRFTIGQHADILAHFIDNVEAIRQNYRNEQAYLSDQLAKKSCLGFWPMGWCPSFKYHCLPKFPANLWEPPFIPDGARIILFHGHPEPQEARRGISGKWYRYFQPCEWIDDHWCE